MGLLYLLVFPEANVQRDRIVMNEELNLAIEELRIRPRDRAWFLPAVFPGGAVPDWQVGAREALRDFN
jgi:hypothetical protein